MPESAGNTMTTVLAVHVPSTPGRAINTLVVLRDGAIIARYAKLHLYDAFSIQESRLVDRAMSFHRCLKLMDLRLG